MWKRAGTTPLPRHLWLKTHGMSVRRYFNSDLTTDTYLNFGFLVGEAEASNRSDSVTADLSSTVLTVGKTWINNRWNFDGSIGFRNISIDRLDVSSRVDSMPVFVIAKHRAVVVRIANDDKQSSNTGKPTRERESNKCVLAYASGFHLPRSTATKIQSNYDDTHPEYWQ